MHAASIIMLCWAMIGAACCVSGIGAEAALLSLGSLVALVGVPHGAADHRFARWRLEPLLGRAWAAVFLVGYPAVALLVVLGWMWAPSATIVLFFLASAWHFGQEEPRLAVGPRLVRPALRFARGGLVIWTPLVFRGDEVMRHLGIVAPRGLGPDARGMLEAATIWSCFMLATAAVAWSIQGLMAVKAGGWRRRVLLVDNVMVASLVTLFAVVSPVVGFIVYFCGWHSARGLNRLRRELAESWPQLARSVAPLTALAIGLAVAGVCGFFPTGRWNDGVIRATFLGLSAVAVPHLLLHGVAPLLAPAGPRAADRPAHLGITA
jgi:Brp/Blh family beta-carotene 15,15'-monooxygenase